MSSILAIEFLSPILLLALLALPVLWWLLRATPPSPVHFRFPGVRLLLGLLDKEKMPDKTPLWLLLIRMAAIAAAILAFANPVINPEDKPEGTGPLLVIMDGGWASAATWQDRIDQIVTVLEQAARSGRPTAFISLANYLGGETGLVFRDASAHLPIIQAMDPQSWAPDRVSFIEAIQAYGGSFDTYWLTDALSRGDSGLAKALLEKGNLRVIGMNDTPLAVLPLRIVEDQLVTTIISLATGQDREITVNAYGLIPTGAEVVLASQVVTLTSGETNVQVEFDLPVEIRNRVTKVVIAGPLSAAYVALADDSLQRRKVALVDSGEQAGPQLTREMFYLRKALEPTADLIEGDLSSVMLSGPDVIILGDTGDLSFKSRERLLEWVDKGGLLMRFSGPSLAASGIGLLEEDPLLPVRLRAGGRQLGGAMSWTEPKMLMDFPENSPFFALTVPGDVLVNSQVVAQPDPTLSDRSLAMLEDGTPLVTRKFHGDGMVVLFHVTANAEWSNLPLSGLFVQMLERLSISASGSLSDDDLIGRNWSVEKTLNGYGVLQDAQSLPPVSGERLTEEPVGPDAQPGIYSSGDRRIAINVLHLGDELNELELPAGQTIEVLEQSLEVNLKHWFILAAIALLISDIFATLLISGRFRNAGLKRALVLLAMAGFLSPSDIKAQVVDEDALYAANNTVLAYVITGDAQVDETSEAGLFGLGLVLNERTSIEPVDPVGVNIETDELAFYPLLYWPLSENQPALSDETARKLNIYMANGGMIFFDTRDAQLGSSSNIATPNGRALQRISQGLDIPTLVPAGEDHVLTRSFYLLETFPGRWVGPELWVQSYSKGLIVAGESFASVNDGVTPVIIGANDWASAWAITRTGRNMFPVGRGQAGEKQREVARRFGVNLIMYVMTGNYKSDQVHVKDLLERLGE